MDNDRETSSASDENSTDKKEKAPAHWSTTGALLERYGAVSAETAAAMAAGALKNSLADITVAITGIAGPGGGSKQKPVGLVHFAAASRGGRFLARERRYGEIGRQSVREQSVAEALDLLETLAQEAEA